MKIKLLSPEEANIYFNRLGLRIGERSTLRPISPDDTDWKHYRTPRDARDLYGFSYQVYTWLAKGDWKILQIDDATFMFPEELSLLERILDAPEGFPNLQDLQGRRTLLFEYFGDAAVDTQTEIVISNVIFLFLLFEWHGHLVSSNRDSGRYLGLQDGFVYFFFTDSSDAKMLDRFVTERTMPDWLVELRRSSGLW